MSTAPSYSGSSLLSSLVRDAGVTTAAAPVGSLKRRRSDDAGADVYAQPPPATRFPGRAAASPYASSHADGAVSPRSASRSDGGSSSLHPRPVARDALPLPLPLRQAVSGHSTPTAGAGSRGSRGRHGDESLRRSGGGDSARALKPHRTSAGRSYAGSAYDAHSSHVRRGSDAGRRGHSGTASRHGEYAPAHRTSGARRVDSRSRSGGTRSPRDSRSLSGSGGGAHTRASDGVGGGERGDESDADSGDEKDDELGHLHVVRGDIIGKKYEVVAETGKGTFGKVLLCTDTSTGTSVAIKVVRSIEKYTVAAETEASILEDVMEADRRGTSFIVRYHQSFKFKGHFCIVFELLGPSLFDYVKANGYRPMPLACVQAFADQLLTAVGFMHRMNLIHTDLKLENVLLVSREPFHKCNEPTSSRKHETVLAPASAAIKLIDFGGATYDWEHKSSIINTRQYRSPEVILGLGWSMASDMWSIGCILMECYTGELLFQTHDNAEHLALMEAILGTFPDSISKARSREVRKYFDRHGRQRFPDNAKSRDSVRHVRNTRRLADMVYYRDTIFLDLVRGLLAFDPSERLTAQQALDHEFFVRVRGKVELPRPAFLPPSAPAALFQSLGLHSLLAEKSALDKAASRERTMSVSSVSAPSATPSLASLLPAAGGGRVGPRSSLAGVGTMSTSSSVAGSSVAGSSSRYRPGAEYGGPGGSSSRATGSSHQRNGYMSPGVASPMGGSSGSGARPERQHSALERHVVDLTLDEDLHAPGSGGAGGSERYRLIRPGVRRHPSTLASSDTAQEDRSPAHIRRRVSDFRSPFAGDA